VHGTAKVSVVADRKVQFTGQDGVVLETITNVCQGSRNRVVTCLFTQCFCSPTESSFILVLSIHLRSRFQSIMIPRWRSMAQAGGRTFQRYFYSFKAFLSNADVSDLFTMFHII
jgi:hypothetical protein